MMILAPVLTPHGLLTLRPTEEAPALEPELGSRLEQAFARGSGHGLLWLGANEVGTALPPMTSAEYLTAAVLAELWLAMDAAFDAELAQAKLSAQEFLKRRHPAW